MICANNRSNWRYNNSKQGNFNNQLIIISWDPLFLEAENRVQAHQEKAFKKRALRNRRRDKKTKTDKRKECLARDQETHLHSNKMIQKKYRRRNVGWRNGIGPHGKKVWNRGARHDRKTYCKRYGNQGKSFGTLNNVHKTKAALLGKTQEKWFWA